jgi:hypothetical protein
MEIEHEHQDTYGETFFYTIIGIFFFSHKCHVEKSAVQVYILQFLFLTVNENMEQVSKWFYKNQKSKKLRWLLFILMGWDYVSEMQPPTDLLFTPHVIYACGELW